VLQDTTVTRQPILSRNMKVTGYQLLLHSTNQNDKPNMDTLKAVHEQHDLPSLIGSAKLFLPFEEIDLTVELIDLYPNTKDVVIEIDAHIIGNAVQLKTLKTLRQSGAFLLLKNYQPNEACNKVVSACQLAKIDTKAFNKEQLLEMIHYLHDKSIQVIADTVEDENEFSYLHSLGFNYFQGFFFTKPTISHGKKLSANKISILQLLAKVNNEDTDFDELATIISHDVALSHKLLTSINHPSMNLPKQVTSIVEAIRYMGMKRLKLWVNMALMSSMDDKPDALMETSLIRAKFCELLADHSHHETEKNSFFLVGLFSTLGAYFDLPQSEVLDDLPLADNLKRAMTDYEGALGKALWIIKQFENPYSDLLMSLSYEDMDIMSISDDYLSATRWGHDTLAGI